MLRLGPKVLGVAALLVSITTSCCGVIWCQPPPPAPCDIESLLVTESVFPTGWEGEPPSPEDATRRLGIEKIGKVFYSPGPVAVHHVYRATSARAAAAGYEDFQTYFSAREGQSDWIVPEGLSFQNSIADQFRFACAVRHPSEQEMCRFVGQYEVYVVRFHANMSVRFMTYQDLEQILQDIDRRMAECLGR